MGIVEKIKEIEAEMARTQKNKATGSYVFSIFVDTPYIHNKIINFTTSLCCQLQCNCVVLSPFL